MDIVSATKDCHGHAALEGAERLDGRHTRTATADASALYDFDAVDASAHEALSDPYIIVLCRYWLITGGSGAVRCRGRMLSNPGFRVSCDTCNSYYSFLAIMTFAWLPLWTLRSV